MLLPEPSGRWSARRIRQVFRAFFLPKRTPFEKVRVSIRKRYTEYGSPSDHENLGQKCSKYEENKLDDDGLMTTEGFQLEKRRPRVFDSLLSGVVNGRCRGMFPLTHTSSG